MLRDLVTSFKAYWEAWTIIVDKKLWMYLVIPGLISLFYGLTVGFTAWYWSDNLKDLIYTILPTDSNSRILSKITSGIVGVGIATTGVVIYKYVIMILLSPILNGLSRRVEEAVIGYSISYRKESDETVLKEYSRSLQFGLRNFLKEILFTCGLLIIGLIPFMGYVATPAIFLIQAMYAGYVNLDFTLGRYFSINGSIDFIRKNFGFSLGNGIAFFLIIMIPVVGLFFAPTLGTAAATLKSVPRIYRPSIA